MHVTHAGIAHADNPVEFCELAGHWLLVQRPGGVGKVKVVARWRGALDERACVKKMGWRATSIHKIKLDDVANAMSQKALMLKLKDVHHCAQEQAQKFINASAGVAGVADCGVVPIVWVGHNANVSDTPQMYQVRVYLSLCACLSGYQTFRC
jgi:hypothetical protein